MLTIAERDKWKRIRNTLTPAFSALKMKQMIPLMNACCDNLIKKLSGVADKEQSVNISKWVCYVRFSFYSLLSYQSYCPCKPRSLNYVTCEFINLIVNYRQLWHQPVLLEWVKRSIKPYPYEHYSTQNLVSLTHLGLVPERKICANPGLKFCLFFVFYFPMYCLE